MVPPSSCCRQASNFMKSNYFLKLLDIYALEKTVPCIEVDKDDEGEEEEQEVMRKKSQPKEI